MTHESSLRRNRPSYANSHIHPRPSSLCIHLLFLSSRTAAFKSMGFIFFFCHFPKGFNFTPLLFSQHPTSSPFRLSCRLRNQTQVCHCWESNRGKSLGSTSKRAPKDYTLYGLWNLSRWLVFVDGRMKVNTSHLTCLFLLPLTPISVVLAVPLSTLNVHHWKA